MSSRAHLLRWLPAFLVGMCAATAAELAVGLLLYSGPGFMRSLTTVLGVEAGALGAGLWTAPSPRPDILDSLRRRWLLGLLSFLLATVFSAFWSIARIAGGSAPGQGMGLAFMAGLPLYACGGVLGGMASANVGEPAGRGTPIGAPAFLGAALGFGATGIFLPHVVAPASLLLSCLVLLSAAGLVYGSVVDARLRAFVRARRATPSGEVRVEDRHLLVTDSGGRFLLEGEHVRRWVRLGGEERPIAWDLAVLGSLAPEGDDAYRVLLVGGGASSLPAEGLPARRSVVVDVVERHGEILELADEHMGTHVSGEVAERTNVHVGNVEDVLEVLRGPYRLILVDAAAFGAVGGIRTVSRHLWDLIWSRLDRDGALAVGCFDLGDDVPDPPGGGAWTRYRRRLDEGIAALEMPIPSGETVLAVRGRAEGPLPDEMDGFVKAVEPRP
ncbi:MAG: hypothetical protein LJF04_18645 [Gemmatimonadetes bacterium]|nr:hypothetical protein [Gemmatimonadota bacterium]